MERAADRAGVVSMVGFNYRFIPAVQLARRLITEGAVGKIHHAHFQYIDESYIDPNMSLTWRMDREQSGRGVLGDVGSHAIDLARFLLGEPEAVSGFTRVIVEERGRQKTSAPDAAFGMLHFRGGEIASLEASAFATGKKNALSFQIYGRDGALAWDLERLNELQVYLVKDKAAGISGFHAVYVSTMDHEDLVPWPPSAHPMGIDISYLLEFHHFVTCIAKGGAIAPLGTDFSDGLTVELICEGLERSSQMDGRRVVLNDVAKEL
jgi:predicted dehydrogenase